MYIYTKQQKIRNGNFELVMGRVSGAKAGIICQRAELGGFTGLEK